MILTIFLCLLMVVLTMVAIALKPQLNLFSRTQCIGLNVRKSSSDVNQLITALDDFIQSTINIICEQKKELKLMINQALDGDVLPDIPSQYSGIVPQSEPCKNHEDIKTQAIASYKKHLDSYKDIKEKDMKASIDSFGRLIDVIVNIVCTKQGKINKDNLKTFMNSFIDSFCP